MKHNQHTKYTKSGTPLSSTMRLMRMALVMTVVCCLSALNSCSNDPVDEPKVPEEQEARRTVLVYMVANNTLNNYGVQDRKEMLEAAALGSIPKDCQMLLYYLDYSHNPSLYRITPDSLERLVDYVPTLSSVSSQRMSEVIADAKRIAPAKEYGMVLWSHASGWYEDGIENSTNTNEANASKSRAYVPSTSKGSNSGASTYSFGSTSANETMNITTLAKVLDGQDMDFLYFDCCFMASTEALYELRNVTKQVYASAAEMHVDGSRWDLVTQDLFAPDKADLVKAAERNYEYYNSLFGSDRTLTVSVTNMENLQELGDICAEIYENAPSAYIPTGYTVQNYGYQRSYRDAFYDLADYMAVLTRNNPELMERFEQCMEKTIAFKAATPYVFGDLKIESHCGLSVNIIETSAEANIKNYRNLQWFNDVTSKLNY